MDKVMHLGEFVIKLDIRKRGEYLSAICADVPGLHVYGKTPSDVRESAMKAIPRLMKSNRHMNIEVSPTDDSSELLVKVVSHTDEKGRRP